MEASSMYTRRTCCEESCRSLLAAVVQKIVWIESCSFGVRCVVGARILIGFLLNYDGNLLFSFSEGRLISVTRVLSQCDLPKIMCMIDARVDNISARVFWCRICCAYYLEVSRLDFSKVPELLFVLLSSRLHAALQCD